MLEKGLAVFCDQEGALGFSLAGVSVVERRPDLDAHEQLEEQLGAYSTVILSGDWFAELSEKARKAVLERELPFVMVFPLGRTTLSVVELDFQLADQVRRMTGFDLLGANR